MFVSLEVFMNIVTLVYVAILVLIVVVIVSQLVVAVAKLRAIRRLNLLKKGFENLQRELREDMEAEDPHTHFETHAHEAGEAIAKGDLVIARDGLLMRANRKSFAPSLAVDKMSMVDVQPKTFKKLKVNVKVGNDEARKAKNRERVAKYRASKKKLNRNK